MTDRERLEALLADEDGERDLREWAYESYKDFNGIKARWMLAPSYPIEGVIDWIVAHFTWVPDLVRGEPGWKDTMSFQDDAA